MVFQPKAFTVIYDKIKDELINEILISPVSLNHASPPDPKSAKQYSAVWDTGATKSVITQKVVEECGLQPIGMTKAYTAGGAIDCNIYLIDIFLPNRFCVSFVRVTDCYDLGGDSDVLIGMDIINLGDLCVTNYNGKTAFSFRMPSMEFIDFQKPFVPKPIKVEPKPGRNDPCPCGSGKKYKHCHGR